MYAVVSFVFFFKQKTAYEMRISDWSSDVCSSDLFGQVEDRLALDQRGIGMACRQARRSDRGGVGDPGGRHAAADDPFPVVGLEPIDAARFVGQPLDRKSVV